MKTLKTLIAERATLLAEIETDGFEMTDEVLGRMQTLTAEIEQARAAEEALAQFRASVPAGTAVDATPSVRPITVVRDRAVDLTDVRAQVDAWFEASEHSREKGEQRMSLASPLHTRAALTTSSIFAGGEDPATLKGLSSTRRHVAVDNDPTPFLTLFPRFSTDAGYIDYTAEIKNPSNGAGETAEGALKPENTYSEVEKTAKLVTVASWITMTRQSARNKAEVASRIEGRLTSDVAEKIDKQAYNGEGTGALLLGVRNSGITEFTSATGVDNEGENIYRSIKRAQTVAYRDQNRPATHVVLNPEDAETLSYWLDETRRGAISLIPVWSKDQPVGKALVGDLTNPNVLELAFRDQMMVRMTDSHAGNFVENKITLLAEQEVAVLVYKPQSIVEVTFGPLGTGGSPVTP